MYFLKMFFLWWPLAFLAIFMRPVVHSHISYSFFLLLLKKRQQIEIILGFTTLCSLQPANSVFLSHQTSTSQLTVLFSHNKSAPATSHSQPKSYTLARDKSSHKITFFKTIFLCWQREKWERVLIWWIKKEYYFFIFRWWKGSFIFGGVLIFNPSKKLPLNFFAQNSPHYVCQRYFCITK